MNDKLEIFIKLRWARLTCIKIKKIIRDENKLLTKRIPRIYSIERATKCYNQTFLGK